MKKQGIERAHSVIEIRSVDEESRIITGLATTPSTDRYEDIVEPKGAQFTLPIPFLWQHRHDQPIGHVVAATVKATGIEVRIQLARIEEAGSLRDRLDEAWQSIKSGLVRGLSVGFVPLESANIEGGWGRRFLKWDWLELSAVTIPANAEANIQSVKSFDHDAEAASGRNRSGVVRLTSKAGASASTTPPKPKPQEGHSMKTVTEQIAEFKAKKAANLQRMNEITKGASDLGRSFDAAEAEEFDTLHAENEQIDKHVPRLELLEKSLRDSATPVPAGGPGSQAAAPVVRAAGSPNTVQLKTKQEPGVAVARIARCLGLAQGNRMEAFEISKRLYQDDAPVQSVLKAAVAAGNTGNAGWAGNLVGEETSVFADFVAFLRPQTITGRFGANGIPALRSVPFRVPLIGQSTGGAGYWVGEGKGKPVTKFDFTRTTIEPLKVANIAVVTEEVLRDSSPSADMLIRDALVEALRSRMDTDFVDPAKAAAANVSPASITNGATAIASTGTDADAVRADLRALWATFIAANLTPTSAVYIMSSLTALSLSLMTNALGQPEFPNIGMNGGTLNGVPVITSEYVPTDTSGSLVILANASDIYWADEGGFQVDISREASLQMDDAPTQDGVTPTASAVVSLWQTNCVGFRAERTVNWARRRTNAVAYLTGVLWGAPAP